jgi:hypothetical protein
VHIPDCKRKKLDPKAIPCWLVGYGEETKGWRLYDPVSKKIIISRDVTFDEQLLISDFKDSTERNKTKQSDCTLLFDPFLLSTEILNLDLELPLDPDTTNPVHVERDEEQPDIVNEQADEPPVVMEEDVTLPRHGPEIDDTTDSEENVQARNEYDLLSSDEIEPDAEEDRVSTRRSNRTPKYSARYQEFRKSLGLIGLIGNISIPCT